MGVVNGDEAHFISRSAKLNRKDPVDVQKLRVRGFPAYCYGSRAI